MNMNINAYMEYLEGLLDSFEYGTGFLLLEFSVAVLIFTFLIWFIVSNILKDSSDEGKPSVFRSIPFYISVAVLLSTIIVNIDKTRNKIVGLSQCERFEKSTIHLAVRNGELHLSDEVAIQYRDLVQTFKSKCMGDIGYKPEPILELNVVEEEEE